MSASGGTGGVRARLHSRVGELAVPVEVSDEMMPGVLSLPQGFGHEGVGTRTQVATRLQPGANFNKLSDEMALDAPSGTAVLNGIPVELTPA